MCFSMEIERLLRLPRLLDRLSQTLISENKVLMGDCMMNSNKLSLRMIVVTLSTAAMLATGCATNRIDLVDEGIVSVDTVPSKRVKVLWTDVYQDGEDFVVYGVVQRLSHTSYLIKTHVDITILSPDGTVLQEARTPDIYVPTRIPGKGINWERFQVRLPDIPPQGSKVGMVVHSGSHGDKT